MRFCVECGKETERIFDGLCAECAAERVELVLPKVMSIEYCKECGSLKKGKNWQEEKDPLLSAVRGEMKLLPEEATLNDLEIRETGGDPYLKLFEMTASISAFGVDLIRKRTVEIRIHRSLCPSCGKKHGGYYEAKLQLRGSIPDNWENSIKEAYAEETRGGIDLYFPSLAEEKDSVKRLLSLRNAERKESKKLHTVKDGKNVYKYTTLLRFYESSDIGGKQKRRRRG